MSRSLRLQVVLNAVDKLTRPFRSAQESNKRLAGAVRQSRDALKDLNRQAGQIDGFRKTKQQLTETQQAYQAATQRVATLAREMTASGNPTRQQAEALKRAQREAAQLKTRFGELQRSTQQQRSALQANGISTNQLGQAQRRLNSDITRTTQQLQRQERQLRRSAEQERRMAAARGRYQQTMETRNKIAGQSAGALATGVATGMILLEPVQAYSESENAATQLKVSMMTSDGSVLPEFEKINDLAVRLGDKLPGTTADFQSMMTMLRRQGMSASVILNGLGESAAYLGVQLKMPPEAAAEFAAKLQDATQTTEKDMMQLMDVIQKSYYAGVDPQNMLQGFSKISSAMSILRMKGIEASQAFAPFLVMADQAGMAGESAGNAYRKIFQGVMNTDKVKNVNEDLKGKGVRFDFTDGKGEFAGIDKMFSQLGQLKKLSTEDRLRTIKGIFGDDAETLQVLNILIEKGISGYQEVQGKLAAQAGLRERVDATLNTLANKWEAATGSFTNTMAALGGTIAPVLKNISDWLGEAANNMSEFIKRHPVLTGVAFKLAAGLALVATAVGVIGLSIAAILGPLAMAKLSMSVLGIKGAGAFGLLVKGIKFVSVAIFTAGKALLTNPIFLAIAIIAGAAYLIWKNWDWLSQKFGEIWKKVSDVTSQAWNNMLAAFREKWDSFSKGMADMWQSIKNKFSEKWNEIVTEFKNLPETLKATASELIDKIIEGINAKWEDLKNKFAEIKQMAKDALTPDWLKEAKQDQKFVTAVEATQKTTMSGGIRNANWSIPPKKFAGAYDSGGHIPRGQFGIVGENGPEVIDGPTNVTGRKSTAALAMLALSTLSQPIAAQPVQSAGGSHGNSYSSQQYAAPVINIYPTPAQSAQDIAHEVARQLDAINRRQQAASRSSYRDTEEF